jgi:hypothetical protein
MSMWNYSALYLTLRLQPRFPLALITLWRKVYHADYWTIYEVVRVVPPSTQGGGRR